MDLSVIIPAHNPDLGRLRATLAALRAQTLPSDRWETILVDNASTVFPDRATLHEVAPPNLTLTREPELGLSAARRHGFAAAQSPVVVLVDDDNVLTPGYLAAVLDLFARHPSVGLAGGPSRPQFEAAPAEWTREFFPLLALRDLGAAPLIAAPAVPLSYPNCAPIGAGLAARREALQSWLTRPSRLSDRRGGALTSAGDNDIVLCALRAGWSVGYFPELELTHLIPASRLAPAYLARLNRGIQSSWMQVLSLHGANSWGPVPAWTVPLRQLKAWWTHRTWRGAAEFIRWQGACGHFEGRARSHSPTPAS